MPDGQQAAEAPANSGTTPDASTKKPLGKLRFPANCVIETQSGKMIGIIGNPFPKPEVEAALKDLSPGDRELVERVLENHASLSIDEAIEMLKAFGGLYRRGALDVGRYASSIRLPCTWSPRLRGVLDSYSSAWRAALGNGGN